MKKSFLLLTSLLLISVYSHAKESKNWGPCRGTIHEFCSQIPKNDTDAMISCLSRNKRHLTSSCDTYLYQTKQKRKNEKRYERDHIPACSSEEKRFCSKVKPGNGRLKACLRLHKDHLSPKCREELKSKSLFY